ncbi:hypothetical protein HD554DRAFT_2038230 [Boletus coccyginus]|nr:hypothetical protein HD554DRAFT_2038230 [Boletus coccyginus]
MKGGGEIGRTGEWDRRLLPPGRRWNSKAAMLTTHRTYLRPISRGAEGRGFERCRGDRARYGLDVTFISPSVPHGTPCSWILGRLVSLLEGADVHWLITLQSGIRQHGRPEVICYNGSTSVEELEPADHPAIIGVRIVPSRQEGFYSRSTLQGARSRASVKLDSDYSRTGHEIFWLFASIMEGFNLDSIPISYKSQQRRMCFTLAYEFAQI